MRDRLTLLVFIFGLISFSISCSSQENVSEVKLALDWYPNANHIGLYLAEENSYFED